MSAEKPSLKDKTVSDFKDLSFIKVSTYQLLKEVSEGGPSLLVQDFSEYEKEYKSLAGMLKIKFQRVNLSSVRFFRSEL